MLNSTIVTLLLSTISNNYAKMGNQDSADHIYICVSPTAQGPKMSKLTDFRVD